MSKVGEDASCDCPFPLVLPVFENCVSQHQSDRQALEVKFSALALEEKQIDKLTKLKQLHSSNAEREASLAQKRWQLFLVPWHRHQFRNLRQKQNLAYLVYQNYSDRYCSSLLDQ